MFTWTNQPYDAMWDHLRMLQAPKNVEALLTGRFESKRAELYRDNEDTVRKSHQIAYAIRQADEYFSAADAVSITTSPLMYFYGMLSLAKALIVANDRTLFLDDIQYHGLHTRPFSSELRAYSSDHFAWSMGGEFAVTHQGVFDVFVRLIHRFSFPDKSIVKFKDILRANPEMGDIYARYYREAPGYFPLYHYQMTESPFRFEINPETTDVDDFLRSFDFILGDFEVTNEIRHGQALVVVNKSHLASSPDYMGIYLPVPGGRFLVSGVSYEHDGTSSRRYLCPEICDYIGMFILGNVVRYKQEFWGQMVAGERDGAIALVKLFVSIARNRFPNFVLNHIFGETFSYGSVARRM